MKTIKQYSPVFCDSFLKNFLFQSQLKRLQQYLKIVSKVTLGKVLINRDMPFHLFMNQDETFCLFHSLATLYLQKLLILRLSRKLPRPCLFSIRPLEFLHPFCKNNHLAPGNLVNYSVIGFYCYFNVALTFGAL